MPAIGCNTGEVVKTGGNTIAIGLALGATPGQCVYYAARCFFLTRLFSLSLTKQFPAASTATYHRVIEFCILCIAIRKPRSAAANEAWLLAKLVYHADAVIIIAINIPILSMAIPAGQTPLEAARQPAAACYTGQSGSTAYLIEIRAGKCFAFTSSIGACMIGEQWRLSGYQTNPFIMAAMPLNFTCTSAITLPKFLPLITTLVPLWAAIGNNPGNAVITPGIVGYCRHGSAINFGDTPLVAAGVITALGATTVPEGVCACSPQ